MLPDAWPLWLQAITVAGAVATALLAVTSLLVKAGHGVSIAARWVRGVVVDAITDVVRDHTLSPDQVAEVVEAKIAPIVAEVRPNGGASLNDKVTRVERMLTDHISNSSLDRSDLRHWLENLDPGRMTHRPDPPAEPEDGPAY